MSHASALGSRAEAALRAAHTGVGQRSADGLSHVTAQLGFQDEVNAPHLLDLAIRQGLEGDCQLNTASYFLSRMTIVATSAPGDAPLREEAVHGLARNASDAVVYFRLPVDRTVVLGSHVTF